MISSAQLRVLPLRMCILRMCCGSTPRQSTPLSGITLRHCCHGAGLLRDMSECTSHVHYPSYGVMCSNRMHIVKHREEHGLIMKKLILVSPILLE